MKKFFIIFLIPLAILLLIWHFISIRIGSILIIPPPSLVFFRLIKLIQERVFWNHVFYTMFRTFLSFFYSLVFSLFLGIAIGLNKNISQLFTLPLSIIKATPVVSFILLALFWFKTSQVPVFVSVLMTLPIITSSVAHGIASVDKRLIEMARVYSLSKWQIILRIYLPAMFPSFASGSLSAFGLSWKVVVASEVISLPQRALGTALQSAKVHIETIDVFAISFIIIGLSFFLELVLSQAFQNLMKWRACDE